MENSLRRAKPEDAEPMTDLYAAFFREDAIETPKEQIRHNLERMLKDERAAIWIAEGEAGEMLGFSSASLTFDVEFGCAAEIEDLYVIPAARGRGLSRHLLMEALGWAEQSGAREIMLVITPESEAEQGLVQFYEKFGFRDSQRTMMYRRTGS